MTFFFVLNRKWVFLSIWFRCEKFEMTHKVSEPENNFTTKTETTKPHRLLKRNHDYEDQDDHVSGVMLNVL